METKAIKGQEVTITVTPAEGYLIAKSDMEVIAVKDPVSATRGDGSIPIGSALVLTLSGKGTAGTVNTKGGSEEMPWSQFSAGITELVIEGDIEALGDGVLKDLTALTAITLKSSKFVSLGNNELPKNVAVDVPGQLYNEYKASKEWGGASLDSKDAGGWCLSHDAEGRGAAAVQDAFRPHHRRRRYHSHHRRFTSDRQPVSHG